MLKVSVFDLEGPLSPADHAALACKFVGDRLGVKNFENIFEMISNYDDYLVDNPHVQNEIGIGEYNAGDTLRLVAPFLAHYLTDSDMIAISEGTDLIVGAKETIDDLRSIVDDIFVISTSYQQHAHNITKRLNIDQKNVYCTRFDMKALKEKTSHDLIYALQNDVFEKYQRSNIDTVLEDLHTYFWGKNREVFSQITVRGGAKKAEALKLIAHNTSVDLSQGMCVGDSITDMNMLEYTKNGNGFSVSFNGNQYSTKHANIVVVSPSLYAVYLIAYWSSFDKIDQWTEIVGMSNDFSKIPKDLVTDTFYEHFKQLDYAPIICNIKNADKETLDVLIEKQKEMRIKNRGWAGKLS